MTWTIGETVTEQRSAGYAGLTFTRTASAINDVATVWNPTITEVASAVYSFSYVPAVAGSYEWSGLASDGFTTLDINFTVENEVSLTLAGATITRRELRQRIADRFEDLVVLTATSNGTTTTFIDNFNVSAASEHYNGRVLYFTNGSNEHDQARVTGTSGSTLTFTPAVGSATETNDTAEVYNRRGLGFTPDQYHRAINNAISDANYIGTIPVLATVAGTFDDETPEVTVPASILRIQTVEYQDENGDWATIPPARMRGGDGWFADKSLGQIRIHGVPARQADGKALRIHGVGLHPAVDSDTDTIATKWCEYLVSRAAYHLAFGAIHKHDSFGQMVTIFQQESERLRTRVRTLRDPNEKGARG